MLQQAFTNTVGTNEKIESLNKDREGFSKQRENTRPKHTDASELTNAPKKNINSDGPQQQNGETIKQSVTKKDETMEILSVTGHLSQPMKKESLSHINSGRKKKSFNKPPQIDTQGFYKFQQNILQI